jgi:hypothetical protein
MSWDEEAETSPDWLTKIYTSKEIAAIRGEAPVPPLTQQQEGNDMSERKMTKWPPTLKIRDTKINDDLGGLGQNIYTTAGSGYERKEYTRADIANARIAELEAALQCVLGYVNTPIPRRRLGIKDHHPEWLTQAIAALNPSTEEAP